VLESPPEAVPARKIQLPMGKVALKVTV